MMLIIEVALPKKAESMGMWLQKISKNMAGYFLEWALRWHV